MDRKANIIMNGSPSNEGKIIGQCQLIILLQEVIGMNSVQFRDFTDRPRYQQAHKPILEQDTIEGHSVRAMYLLTAVADLALIDKEGFAEQYIPALQRLWDNMVNKKMYLTGGIGAMKQWEGFGIDYFLPQSTDEGGCYSETCAAIGVMMLAERLLQVIGLT